MKPFLFCVDSDGCAMDTMTYKHKLFFGPLIAKYFPIDDPEGFQTDWETLNLYSRTRGVNRFTGLMMALQAAKVPNIEHLVNWAESTTSLSNASLEQALRDNPSEDLEKALAWSNDVNHHIKHYQGDALAFPNVREGLEKLSQLGSVYVVSSANREAVAEEWEDQGLVPFVTDLYCQDRGKKEDVLAELLSLVDSPDQLLMIGDSPGDCQAAELNQVQFYPIIVGDEGHSWQQLMAVEADAFVAGNYNQDQYKQLFWQNLDR
ncbi:HAD family hydrolase [Streptococcus merionis]|uniref:Haloacid dehalogenase n=1 Tax=Streptococcus merionis TaxID=400065 RepID=A0A239SNV1_9STRE|nr:HAD family hydrolase [Streptococcus merionis]SNU86932.1 haloacid dehalogenase [Streptococcus merionis]